VTAAEDVAKPVLTGEGTADRVDGADQPGVADVEVVADGQLGDACTGLQHWASTLVLTADSWFPAGTSSAF